MEMRNKLLKASISEVPPHKGCAKNFRDVIVVVDPDDYEKYLAKSNKND